MRNRDNEERNSGEWKPPILIVDDLAGSVELLKVFLEKEYDVAATTSPDDALRIEEEHHPWLIISDLKMPGKDGLSLIENIKQRNPDIGSMIITAYADKETAVRAFNLGVDDYIEKPPEINNLRFRVRKIIEKVRERTKFVALKNEQAARDDVEFDEIVGVSPAINNVKQMIKRVAPQDATVMIMGETGVGKELVARAIHKNSKRKSEVFIPVNLSSISVSLLESELFGHVRGAFTGAHRNRTGYFEAADGGTLFLDEISEIGADFQVKLLRVIEQRRITPVGDTRDRPVDVRIIAATNKNLVQLVEEKMFRQDLYYRLNVVPIVVPPLRERATEDIPLLLEHFVQKQNRISGKNVQIIPRELMKRFMEHRYPGNVRELQNLVAQAMALSDGTSLAEPGFISLAEERIPETWLDLIRDDYLDKVDLPYFKHQFLKAKRNRTQCAQNIGIHVQTLRKRLTALGLDDV